MARHGSTRADPAGVQLRFSTPSTSEEYVARQQWRFASLQQCPWHRSGGCGFRRHGTYERINPPGALIPRWYCPKIRRTVSALPDCLASHYSGPLEQLEAIVVVLEKAPSLAAAAKHLRTDIELPGALRYLRRLSRAVHGALGAIRGLSPEHFAAIQPTVDDFATVLGPESVLMQLRRFASRYLAQLPPPLGFNPHRIDASQRFSAQQHRMGPDPPVVIIDPCPRAARRAQ